MDNILNSLSSASNNVFNWVHQTFNPDQNSQEQAQTLVNQEPNQSALDTLSNKFGGWLNSGENFLMQNAPKAESFLTGGLFGGLGMGNNPINNIVAQSPDWINQNLAAPLQNAIPGNNIFSNAARDVVGAGAGIMSLPGVAAKIGQNPAYAGDVTGNIVNEYMQLIADPLGHFQQHPINTILDVLPAAGIIGKLGTLGKAGEVGEAANVGDLARAGTLGEDLTSATSALTPTERLANLLNYPEELANKGFRTDQIDQLSAPRAYELMQKGITPQEFDQNPDILNTDTHLLRLC